LAAIARLYSWPDGSHAVNCRPEDAAIATGVPAVANVLVLLHKALTAFPLSIDDVVCRLEGAGFHVECDVPCAAEGLAKVDAERAQVVQAPAQGSKWLSTQKAQLYNSIDLLRAQGRFACRPASRIPLTDYHTCKMWILVACMSCRGKPQTLVYAGRAQFQRRKPSMCSA
jgi:hypothetical protein